MSTPHAVTRSLVALALALSINAAAAAEPVEPAVDAPAPPAAAPVPLERFRLALRGAGNRLLRLGGDAPTVDFPIDSPPGVPPLTAAVLESTFGNPPASADGIFTARAIVDDTGPRIRIGADPARLRTGAYTVRLRITGPGVEAFEPVVQVSVPAPELRVPASLAVQRHRPLFPSIFGDGDASAEPLVVREVGRFAGLSGIQLTQVGPLELDGRAEVGRIEAAAVADLAPGGSRTLDYTIEPRHLPPGSVQGTLELSARELAEPIRIPVQIDTRIDSIWIVFLVLVGVLLGYISRQLLGRWRARNEALALAAAERQAVLDLAGAAGDTKLQTRLEALRRDLERAVATRDPQNIVTAAEAARAGREAARAELEANHERLGTRFGGVVARLTGRRLPRRITDRLDGRLPPIRQALIDRQTDTARALLDMLTADEGLTVLRATWSDWSLDARRALGTLDRLGDLVEAVPTAGPAASVTPPTDADFDALFDHGGAAFEAVHQVANEVWVLLDGAVEELLVGLGGRVEPGQAAGVRDLIGRARGELAAGAPIEALRLLTGDLLTALAAAITAARPGAETRALLAERRYRAAAEGAAPAGAVLEESSVVGAPDAPPPSSPSGRARPAAEPPPAPAGWQRDLDVARLAIAAAPAPLPVTLPKPLLAEVVGSLINAVVISLVAFVVYEDGFVGDGPQLVSTLLWAYGMDLGAEAVKAQLQRVSPGGAG